MEVDVDRVGHVPRPEGRPRPHVEDHLARRGAPRHVLGGEAGGHRAVGERRGALAVEGHVEGEVREGSRAGRWSPSARSRPGTCPEARRSSGAARRSSRSSPGRCSARTASPPRGPGRPRPRREGGGACGGASRRASPPSPRWRSPAPRPGPGDPRRPRTGCRRSGPSAARGRPRDRSPPRRCCRGCARGSPGRAGRDGPTRSSSPSRAARWGKVAPGPGPDHDRGPGALGQLPVAAHEVGVEVGLDHPADRQPERLPPRAGTRRRRGEGSTTAASPSEPIRYDAWARHPR